MKTFTFLALLTLPLLKLTAKQWFCQASDFSGSFGTGYGSTRGQASLQALLNCQMHGRGGCTIQLCSEI